jgi:hypothetical protein
MANGILAIIFPYLLRISFLSVLLTDFFKYYWIKFYHQDNIGYDWPAISLSFSYPNFLIIILATSLTYLIIIVHNQMTLFFKYILNIILTNDRLLTNFLSCCPIIRLLGCDIAEIMARPVYRVK